MRALSLTRKLVEPASRRWSLARHRHDLGRHLTWQLGSLMKQSSDVLHRSVATRDGRCYADCKCNTPPYLRLQARVVVPCAEHLDTFITIGGELNTTGLIIDSRERGDAASTAATL